MGTGKLQRDKMPEAIKEFDLFKERVWRIMGGDDTLFDHFIRARDRMALLADPGYTGWGPDGHSPIGSKFTEDKKETLSEVAKLGMIISALEDAERDKLRVAGGTVKCLTPSAEISSSGQRFASVRVTITFDMEKLKKYAEVKLEKAIEMMEKGYKADSTPFSY
jgi:hypothetical protein